MNEENMKKIGRQMAIRMGILMSFSLSLIGTLTSGHFTIPGFLISFAVSTVVSIGIGFVIPVGKISMDLCRKWKLQPGTVGHRCAESMISNVIYTPLMTLIMVFLAYQGAMRSSGGQAQIVFLPMFLKSLLICFVAGFMIIFSCMPVFRSSLMKGMQPKE
ncbi:MAG: hypothetical protein K6A92_10840 [Lachnospiraceae bacterium]|nr:hypothetical protein [Lachnospiraceae bacterium]